MLLTPILFMPSLTPFYSRFGLYVANYHIFLFFSLYLRFREVPFHFILFTFLFSLHREERMIRKWRKMIGVGGSDWKHYVRRNPHVVKRRVRKGIPDCLRGLVWQLISGSRHLLLMNPQVYEVSIFSILY
jgi:hypothetical protein